MRAAQACYDMALAYGAPFISGKDSLYNEFEYEGKASPSRHTLLISAMAVMDDVRQSGLDGLKRPATFIYIIGTTYNELGGSDYFAVHGSRRQ